MPSKKALAQIVWAGREVWGLRAASAASKAASKQSSKATAAAAAAAAAPVTAPADVPASTKKPTTSKVKAPPKLYPVSPTLRHFLGGVAEASRTNTLKQVWDYIREHELQDPADKKQVNCDETLKTVLGKDRVNFTEIPGLISPHFPKKEVKK